LVRLKPVEVAFIHSWLCQQIDHNRIECFQVIDVNLKGEDGHFLIDAVGDLRRHRIEEILYLCTRHRAGPSIADQTRGKEGEAFLTRWIDHRTVSEHEFEHDLVRSAEPELYKFGRSCRQPQHG